ncbi:hypothetical protein ACE6H2_020903 [Prunus campanulata]
MSEASSSLVVKSSSTSSPHLHQPYQLLQLNHGFSQAFLHFVLAGGDFFSLKHPNDNEPCSSPPFGHTSGSSTPNTGNPYNPLSAKSHSAASIAFTTNTSQALKHLAYTSNCPNSAQDHIASTALNPIAYASNCSNSAKAGHVATVALYPIAYSPNYSAPVANLPTPNPIFAKSHIAYNPPSTASQPTSLIPLNNPFNPHHSNNNSIDSILLPTPIQLNHLIHDY